MLLYIPLAFACWTAPVIGIICAQTGLFSRRADPSEGRVVQPAGETGG